ncbi:MAG: DUF433 domain-containing protein [Planctomycetes bacterium]|nr:DUF433 domain-containing protein [Planctomycetota bacterium]
MDWRDRITATADVSHGRACIKGTRVMVSVILDNLAAGSSKEPILANHPSLVLDDVDAAIRHAAAAVPTRHEPRQPR